MKRILVMGASGQIGSELSTELANRYGSSNIIASDIRIPDYETDLLFEQHDCLDLERTANLVKTHQIDTIYHLPAILSATAENNPQKAYQINLNGLFNTLEVARKMNCAVFTPSTIGAFGDSTPKKQTPQDTIMRPNTIYGVTKVAGELLCDYYYHKYGLDTRGVRYPGIISNKTLPGGGTTDYAVDIFYQAIKTKSYECYIAEETYLDMMYMPDAIKAAIDLMEADPDKLIHRNAFNISAMSFSPKELADEIKLHITDFAITYNVDPARQSYADSWPNSLDDSAARAEWNWSPDYDLRSMTSDMLDSLSKLKRA